VTVTYDSSGSWSIGGFTNSATQSYSVGVGANGLMVGGSLSQNGTNWTGVTITAKYGTDSMTDAVGGTTTATVSIGGSTSSGQFIFYLLNPATGANNIVLTIVTTQNVNFDFCAISVAGTGSVANVNSANSGSTSTTSGNLVITVGSGMAVGYWTHGDTITGFTNGTQKTINNTDTTSSGGTIVAGIGVAGSNQTFAANSGVSDWWQGKGFEFVDAGGSSNLDVPLLQPPAQYNVHRM
jgi:hypothetical protein